MGKYRQALKDYSKAISLNPAYEEAYYNRGGLYTDHLKDYRKAVSDYSRVVELQPDMARAYHNRAIAWAYLKQYDKAWDDVDRCRKLGLAPSSSFLDALRQASGRQK